MRINNRPLLVGTCLLFGVLMAVRSDVDGALSRTLIAALAGGVLAAGAHAARRDGYRPLRRLPRMLSDGAGEIRQERHWPAGAPRMLTGIEGGPPYCNDA